MSRLDYCNGLLYGRPACHLHKIQRVFTAAARLVCYVPRLCHITPLLLHFHWLPVKERTQNKVLLFFLKRNVAPDYVTNLVELQSGSKYNLWSTNRHLLVPFKRKLRRQWVIDRLQRLHLHSGTHRHLSYAQSWTLSSVKRQLKTHLFSAAFY